jgi:hypothetical protein
VGEWQCILPRAINKDLENQTLSSACLHMILALGIALVVCSFNFYGRGTSHTRFGRLRGLSRAKYLMSIPLEVACEGNGKRRGLIRHERDGVLYT